MKIKVASSFGGVISSGSYENAKPSFSAELEFELDNEALEYEVIKENQELLHQICYGQFKAVEAQMIVERINRERKDIRFYKAPNGKLYPSVTSVLNYDSDFGIPPHQLQQYASQSNICHARVANFVTTSKWSEPKELKECHSDIVICTKGDLGLDIDAGSFPNFLEYYPILEMENGKEMFDDELEVSGLPDLIGIPDIDKGKWKKTLPEIKKVKTVFDVKRTVDEEKNLCQVFIYGKPQGIEQGIIIPLNNKTKQGFSSPLVSQKKDYYTAIFTNKRKAFRERFGC